MEEKRGEGVGVEGVGARDLQLRDSEKSIEFWQPRASREQLEKIHR